MMPNWVAAILDNRPLGVAVRVLLTFMYWSSGFEKLVGFPDAVAEMNHFGLHPGVLFAAATTLTLIGGSALVIWGRYAWLGAGWLAVFTIATIPIAHDFLHVAADQRMEVIRGVREHLSMCAGLFLAAALCRRDRL
jgi:transmembrane protein